MIAARGLIDTGRRNGRGRRRRLAGVDGRLEQLHILLGDIRRQNPLGIVERGVAHTHGLHRHGAMLDDVEGSVSEAQRLAAAFFGVALGDGRFGGLGNGPVHGHQAVARVFNVRRHGITRDHLLVGLGGLVLIHGFQALADRGGQSRSDSHVVRLAGVGVTDAEQHLVALGVKRIGVGYRLKAGDGGHKIFTALVIAADLEFALAQNLLHVAQFLLGARDEGRIREHVDHLPVFLLGHLRVGKVAVGLLHLLVVDVSHFHLGFGGFRSIGEEGDEVLVFGFSLSQRSRPAFLEPCIADRKLGPHAVFRLGVGVKQRL